MKCCSSGADATLIQPLLDRLYSRLNYERKTPVGVRGMKTEAIQKLLEQLGNPHLDYAVVHVGGTKGKGTVTRLMAAGLLQSGYRVGCYTSPHLETFHERISIGGENVDDQCLVNTLTQIFSVVDNAKHFEWTERLTFFDLATAAAFLAFSLSNVELAVVEVGLGGRLDSTNVVPHPFATVITNVSLDHERQLGHTIPLIAREKAGILKDGVPLFTSIRDADALGVVRQVGATKHVRISEIDRDFGAFHVNRSELGSTFDLHVAQDGAALQPAWSKLTIPLAGRHQVDNAALAAAVLFSLKSQWLQINDTAIREAFQGFQHAGRIETLRTRPTVILDVAHNAASTEALIETVVARNDWNTAVHRYLIVSISRDKNREAILSLLLPHFDRVVCTQFISNPRATPAIELAELANALCPRLNPNCRVAMELSPVDAWQHVRSLISADDVCCVAGSLFLVAELRRTILNESSSVISRK